MKLIVVDANAYWTEQLFRQCGRFADVLLLKPRDFRAHRRQTGRLRSDAQPRRIADRVFEQRLSMPPCWMVTAWWWSQGRLGRVIREFAGAEPFTLVITFPQYRGLITALRPALSVYYNLDDYRDNWPRLRTQVPKWERETVLMSAVTICIADYRVRLLQAQHPERRRDIHHLPLGVTPEFMRPDLQPAERTANPRPIAGYVGALNYRFDFEFIAKVAALLPEVDFVLGGRVLDDGDADWRAGLHAAQHTANIKFLGWVDHARLPEHHQSFDVLLMPYAHCNFNTNACPAKLWDYLGTGKPIVANDANPETLMWRDTVCIGATAEEFAAAIRVAIADTEESSRARRLQIARDHTWEKLSERLELILNQRTSQP